METQERSKRVLAALVREYIASGEPVASSVLVTAAGLGVSSATVRNILARLEDEGFVQQPHTSAGRIPTDRGYRFYVDLLLEAKRSEPHRQRGRSAAAARRVGRRCSIRCCSQVSHVLSQASRSVGFAVRPAHEAAVFDRVEFVPLSATRVLVVIVARGGHVIQKVDRHRRAARRRDELRAGGQLSERGVLRPAAHRAREAVLERMHEERMLYDALMARALRLATSTFADLPDEQMIYVDGARRCSTTRTG